MVGAVIMPDEPMTFEEWLEFHHAPFNHIKCFVSESMWNLIETMLKLAWENGGYAADMERLKR